MIAHLEGKTILIDENFLIVQSSGVGYKVFVSTEVLSDVQPDNNVCLFIHTIVREDSIALYGFLNYADQKFFETLLLVKGVGPKVALDILSAPRNLTISAIINGEIAQLTQIKGLGKKTAERIIVELKNKVEPPADGLSVLEQRNEADVISALENLGYEKFIVRRLLKDKPAEISETEEIIKWFLQSV